jgi:hypothetical protein
MLQNVSNNFRFRLEKCIEANGGTFEQELQEYPKFHNDAHLFHGYMIFFSSFSCSTTEIFAELIFYLKYCFVS